MLQNDNLSWCSINHTCVFILFADVDLNQLKKTFGSSNEFINSLYKSYIPQLPEHRKPSAELQKELQLLASCTYDNGTDWGEEASNILLDSESEPFKESCTKGQH